MSNACRRSAFALALLLAATGPAVAQPAVDVITLDVRAFIDGRDQLIIRGETLQWHHFDFAAPGRIGGRNDPTVIATTLNGVPVMDHVAWVPDWPLPPPDPIRFEAFSSVFTGLRPAIPSQDLTVTLQVIEARSILELVQLPAEVNDYMTVVQFNDNGPGGATFYEGQLTYTFQPVPEPAGLALAGCALAAAAWAARRTR